MWWMNVHPALHFWENQRLCQKNVFMLLSASTWKQLCKARKKCSFWKIHNWMCVQWAAGHVHANQGWKEDITARFGLDGCSSLDPASKLCQQTETQKTCMRTDCWLHNRGQQSLLILCMEAAAAFFSSAAWLEIIFASWWRWSVRPISVSLNTRLRFTC